MRVSVFFAGLYCLHATGRFVFLYSEKEKWEKKREKKKKCMLDINNL